MYKIRLKRQAVKEFALLPENIRNIIEEKLILLSIWRDYELDIKLLTPKGDKRYRLRVWKYRIIYKKDNDVLIIYVLKIWTRWDIYKWL